MNITLQKPLVALLVVGGLFFSPISVSASILRTYKESEQDVNNDQFNHRMENAFQVEPDQFASASVGDYIDIQGFGRLQGAPFNDFGDTYRVYLYKDVTYLAFTNPLDRFPAPYNTPGNPDETKVIDDTVLTIVDGGTTAADGPNFDFAAAGYKFVDANDDGSSTNQFVYSSSIEFTAERTGYHYFFVTELNSGLGDAYGDGQSSVSFDNSNNYSSGDAGGIFQGGDSLDSGMYATTSGGLTPTGSVFGDIEADLYYWLRIEQKAGNPPVNPIPEPSSIAIFSVVGIGGLMLRRRMMKKKS